MKKLEIIKKNPEITIFYNSLQYSGLEEIYSRRLLLLVDSLGFPYNTCDLNTDANFNLKETRLDLWKKGKLCKTAGKIILPQLAINEKSIGGYNEAQYLYDSGLLSKIISCEECTHFRRVGNELLKLAPQIFIHGKRQCMNCYVSKINYKNLVIYGYPMNSKNKETLELCNELDKKNIIYKIIDYENNKEFSQKAKDLTEKYDQNLTVFGKIRNLKISYANLIRTCKLGILEELISGIRCKICAKIGCPEKFHKKCEECLMMADWEKISVQNKENELSKIQQIKPMQRMSIGGCVKVNEIKFNF